jgi:hypothetical protein
LVGIVLPAPHALLDIMRSRTGELEVDFNNLTGNIWALGSCNTLSELVRVWLCMVIVVLHSKIPLGLESNDSIEFRE